MPNDTTSHKESSSTPNLEEVPVNLARIPSDASNNAAYIIKSAACSRLFSEAFITERKPQKRFRIVNKLGMNLAVKQAPQQLSFPRL